MRTWTDDASGVVEEHIGPVQFNMGGIQVNADEMVKRLQVRQLLTTAMEKYSLEIRIAKPAAQTSLDHRPQPHHKTQARWTTKS
jgi:hypothetical protein